MWRYIVWFPIISCVIRSALLIFKYNDTPYFLCLKGKDYKKEINRIYKDYG